MSTGKTKRDAGLGRGLESLLEDNSPVINVRPNVVRRGKKQEKNEQREYRDSLYKKEGAISYVKKPGSRS